MPDWKRKLQENIAKKKGIEPSRSVVIISKKGTTTTTNNNVRGSAPKIGTSGGSQNSTTVSHNNAANRNNAIAKSPAAKSSAGRSSPSTHRRTFVSSKPTDEFLNSNNKVNINEIRNKYSSSPQKSGKANATAAKPVSASGKTNAATSKTSAGATLSSSTKSSTTVTSSSPRGSPRVVRSSAVKSDPYLNSKTATKISSPSSRPKSFQGTAPSNLTKQRNVVIKPKGTSVQSSPSPVKISVTKAPDSPKTKSKSPFGALKSMVNSKSSPPHSPKTNRTVLANKQNGTYLNNKRQGTQNTAASTARHASEEVAMTLDDSSSADSGIVLVKKKQLAVFETQDAGHTPPPRRKKNPLPASAIISIHTAGPIQAASGKPALDPEKIAKEKAASTPPAPKNDVKSTANKQDNNNARFTRTIPALSKEVTSSGRGGAVPYPENFRQPKALRNQNDQKDATVASPKMKRVEDKRSRPPPKDTLALKLASKKEDKKIETLSPIPGSRFILDVIKPTPTPFSPPPDGSNHDNDHTLSPVDEGKKDFSGAASDTMMRRARELKKEKKEVEYEIIGGNAKTGKPSILKKFDNSKTKKIKTKVNLFILLFILKMSTGVDII